MADMTIPQIKARDFVRQYNEGLSSLAPDWGSRENQHAILVLATFIEAQSRDLEPKVRQAVDVACSDYHAGFYGPISTRPERRIAAILEGAKKIMGLFHG